MLIEDAFPYVSPPAIYDVSLAVKKKEGTRWYVEEGVEQTLRTWHRELREHFRGNLVPLQWVSDMVGVSRTAVYKRANAGRLTVFTFCVKAGEKPIFGILGSARDRTYDYATVSECEAWRELLLMRAGIMNEEELLESWDEIRKANNRRS